MKKSISFCSLMLAILVSQASAQSRDQMTLECVQNLGMGTEQDSETLVEEIKSWKNIFSTTVRNQGAKCLNILTGEEWGYSTEFGNFVFESELVEIQAAAEAERLEVAEAEEAVRVRICELRDLVAETDLTLQLAEEAQQDRRIETLGATVEACSSWFESDPSKALTNDVCNSIFASGGLPNSEIEGPTASETLLAELRQQNATLELEVLTETGMSLETLAAMTAELGTEEEVDVYNCSY